MNVVACMRGHFLMESGNGSVVICLVQSQEYYFFVSYGSNVVALMKFSLRQVGGLVVSCFSISVRHEVMPPMYVLR